MLRHRFTALLFCVSLTGGFSWAQAPTPGWNINAPIGGSFSRLIEEPPSIHPVGVTTIGGQQTLDYVCDTLAAREPITNDYRGRLAERWEISKDGREYTFFLRKNARFHDGKPVTADDVKFSYEAVFIDDYKGAAKRPFFESVERVETPDQHTVRFRMKDDYFQNFSALADTMYIIPKHIYGDVEKGKKLTRAVTCAGPYTLEKFEPGQRIVLKRFKDWYGFESDWKGAFNFNQVVLRFVPDQAVVLEMVKKGELDYAWAVMPDTFAKAEGEPWGSKVFAVKAENKFPKRSGFIGWNMKNELFQNKNTRIALAHLLNREEINKKFRFETSVLATGPYYVQSEFASPKSKAIAFDPKKAAELLKKAGWSDSDKDGVLDKKIGGKKTDFRFTFLYSAKDFEKYWTLYQEDLKKAGIVMELKFLEWGTFIKLVTEQKFDAITMAWGGTPEWDPKQIWHSQSSTGGGSNFISYKNPAVDKLIDEARVERDKAKRMVKLHKVYELIADDAPYAFLFNGRYELYFVSAKVGRPGDTLPFDNGHHFWWAK